MRALTFQGVRTVGYETVPDPGIQDPGDVVLKVEVSAICGSDLHIYHGREKGLDKGTVLGHEFLGEVVECGAGVNGIAKGDRVVAPFTTSCGSCYYCRTDLTARCEKGEFFGWVQNGKGLHGGQAEFVRVPLAETSLVHVPEGTPAEEALLAGDVLSTGFFVADRAEIGPESVVAVLGCGPVGLMAILGARERGAARIFSIDMIAERLALASKFGATHVVDASTSDPVEAILSLTGGGVEYSFEAIGLKRTAEQSFEVLERGGLATVIGMVPQGEKLELDGSAFLSEKKIQGSSMGSNRFRVDMPKYVDFYMQGRLKLDEMITRTGGLEDLNEAFRAMKAGEVTRTVLSM